MEKKKQKKKRKGPSKKLLRRLAEDVVACYRARAK